MFLILAAFFLVAASAPSDALLGDDFLGGPGESLSPDAANIAFRVQTGMDLTEGARIVGYYEGGFQDRYVQLRIEVSEAALPGLLAALGVDPASASPSQGNTMQNIAGLDWWQPVALVAPGRAHGSFGLFPVVAVLFGSDPSRPGLSQVYLLAFET